mmetsp:Transcript_25051/g.49825  ORF Transcript_25051/g.49825 Transcript_25051/m.49825 type:complete len:95 (-) Transcript_25051:300-584(-)
MPVSDLDFILSRLGEDRERAEDALEDLIIFPSAPALRRAAALVGVQFSIEDAALAAAGASAGNRAEMAAEREEIADAARLALRGAEADPCEGNA